MRAITWAEEFDLNQYIEMAGEDLLEFNVEISPETLIKCVGLTLDVPPTTDGLLQLRDRSPTELKKSFGDAVESLRRVSEFLREQFSIESSEFVPYEGQLLLLFKAIGMERAEGDAREGIVRWFWATGFNESLRGKPDHYVVRAVQNWRGLVRGEIRGLEPRLKLTEIELLERRLVAGGALSKTFTTMHAVHGARSLAAGTRIEPATYMARSDVSYFEPVFGRPELASGGMPHAISARMFGNVVLVDPLDLILHGGSRKGWILRRAANGDWDILASQFIDRASAAALEANDMIGFFRSRVRLMHERARALVGEIN
jgi:hypothetical protein